MNAIDTAVLITEGITFCTFIKSVKEFYVKANERKKRPQGALNFITNKFLLMYEKHADRVKNHLPQVSSITCFKVSLVTEIMQKRRR